MVSFIKGWYLIYTRPRHEKKLYQRLLDININSYLPLKKTLHIWHDRKKYIDDPLFPSYVFVFLNDVQESINALENEGALFYVKLGKQLARVHDTVVARIRLMVESGYEMEMTDALLKPGVIMKISDGPFTGIVCEIVNTENVAKIIVRLEMLKRNILLKVNAGHLIPV